MADRILNLVITSGTTLKQALTKMDEVGYKLLMVVDNYKLIGLVTIGDIQRAIIGNHELDTPAFNFSRRDLIVAKEGESLSVIKQQMLEFRLVYMPVLNDDGSIKEVIFWDDLFGKEKIEERSDRLKLPVVIMAGGFGTRLRPLTYVLPKPLLPIGKKTILEHIIDKFQAYACNDFYVSVNYKSNLIQFYFDQIEGKTFNANFFEEDKPLGTAGSLRLLEDKLNQTFFVSNCDILIEEDYGEIYNYHKNNENELTLVASLKNYDIPYGTVESGENGELIALREKPNLNFMINCGLYILEPHLLTEIPTDTFFHITDLIEKIKERDGKVGVFPVSEKSWTDIGEWQFYSKILFS